MRATVMMFGLNCLIQGALPTSDIEKGEFECRVEELNEQCRMLTRYAVDFGTSSDAEAHEVSGRTSPTDTVAEMESLGLVATWQNC